MRNHQKGTIHGNDSSHQLETTIPLSKEDFEEFNQLSGKRVRKTRYDYMKMDPLRN